MSDLKKIKLEVTGTEKHLATFVQLCRTLDYLGNVGSTRSVHVWFDGDGAARLDFSDEHGDFEDVPLLSMRHGSDDYVADFE